MSASPVIVSPTWLALREEADAQARSLQLDEDLVDDVQRWLPPGGRAVIQELGCGTGSRAKRNLTCRRCDTRLPTTPHSRGHAGPIELHRAPSGPAGLATMSVAAFDRLSAGSAR